MEKPVKNPIDLEIELMPEEGSDFFRIELRITSGGELMKAMNGQAQIDPDALGYFQVNPNYYGRSLSKMLFSDQGISNTFSEAINQAKSPDSILRINLSLPPQLQNLSWELLHDLTSDSPISTLKNVRFSRFIHSPSRRRAGLSDQEFFNKGALILKSTPPNLENYNIKDQRDIDEEAVVFHEALLGYRTEPGFRTEIQTVSSTTELRFLYSRDNTFETLIFVAQAVDPPQSSVRGADQSGILIGSEDHEGTILNIRRFIDIFDKHFPTLTVLSVNSLIGRLGPGLIEDGFPFVIEIGSGVSLKAKQRFMENFARSLIQTGNVDEALAAGRSGLDFVNLQDLGRFVFYTNQLERQLFYEHPVSITTSAKIMEPPALIVYPQVALNARAQPDLAAPVIGTFAKNEPLEVVESDINSARLKLGKAIQWLEVEGNKGRRGHVPARFLALEPAHDDPERQPHTWIVVGTVKGKTASFDWDEQFDLLESGKPGHISWTHVTQGAGHANLGRSQPGDHVLAYVSGRGKPYLAGLGRIASEPYEVDGHLGVDIVLLSRFKNKVTRDEIKLAAPESQIIKQAQPSFCELTAEEWARLRPWILERNPELAKALPPVTVAEKFELAFFDASIEVEPLDGKATYWLATSIQNNGNQVLSAEEKVRFSITWNNLDAHEPASFSGDYDLVLGEPYLPGVRTFSSHLIPVVPLPGRYQAEVTLIVKGRRFTSAPFKIDEISIDGTISLANQPMLEIPGVLLQPAQVEPVGEFSATLRVRNLGPGAVPEGQELRLETEFEAPDQPAFKQATTWRLSEALDQRQFPVEWGPITVWAPSEPADYQVFFSIFDPPSGTELARSAPYKMAVLEPKAGTVGYYRYQAAVLRRNLAGEEQFPEQERSLVLHYLDQVDSELAKPRPNLKTTAKSLSNALEPWNTWLNNRESMLALIKRYSDLQDSYANFPYQRETELQVIQALIDELAPPQEIADKIKHESEIFDLLKQAETQTSDLLSQASEIEPAEAAALGERYRSEFARLAGLDDPREQLKNILTALGEEQSRLERLGLLYSANTGISLQVDFPGEIKVSFPDFGTAPVFEVSSTDIRPKVLIEPASVSLRLDNLSKIPWPKGTQLSTWQTWTSQADQSPVVQRREALTSVPRHLAPLGGVSKVTNSLTIELELDPPGKGPFEVSIQALLPDLKLRSEPAVFFTAVLSEPEVIEQKIDETDYQDRLEVIRRQAAADERLPKPAQQRIELSAAEVIQALGENQPEQAEKALDELEDYWNSWSGSRQERLAQIDRLSALRQRVDRLPPESAAGLIPMLDRVDEHIANLAGVELIDQSLSEVDQQIAGLEPLSGSLVPPERGIRDRLGEITQAIKEDDSLPLAIKAYILEPAEKVDEGLQIWDQDPGFAQKALYQLESRWKAWDYYRQERLSQVDRLELIDEKLDTLKDVLPNNLYRDRERIEEAVNTLKPVGEIEPALASLEKAIAEAEEKTPPAPPPFDFAAYQARYQAVLDAISADQRLPASVRATLDASASRAAAAIASGQQPAAENSVAALEALWNAWQSFADQRLAQFERLARLKENIAGLEPPIGEVEKPEQRQSDLAQSIGALESVEDIETGLAALEKTVQSWLEFQKTVQVALQPVLNEIEKLSVSHPQDYERLLEKSQSEWNALVVVNFSRGNEPGSIKAEIENAVDHLQKELDAVLHPEPVEPEPEPPGGAVTVDEGGIQVGGSVGGDVIGAGGVKTTIGGSVNIYNAPVEVNYTEQPEYVGPPPPAEDHKIKFTISELFIELSYSEKKYRSPSTGLLNDQQLKDSFNFSPTAYGYQLFKHLVSDQKYSENDKPTSAGYHYAREQVGDDPLEIAIETLLKPEHGQFFWEFLTDENEKPLATYENTPFYRQVGADDDRSFPEAKPLNILFAISSPVELTGSGGTQTYGLPEPLPGSLLPPPGRLLPENPLLGAIRQLTPLDREAEVKGIVEGMQSVKEKDMARYTVIGHPDDQEPVSWERILRKIQQEDFHVLHLLAHGIQNSLTGEFNLVLETKDRKFALVSSRDIDSKVVDRTALRLVTLASCRSADATLKQSSGTRSGAQSFAEHLIEIGIPAVIAMQDYMDIAAAQVMTKTLYNDLARHGRIDTSLASARHALFVDKKDNRAWGIPVLLLKGGKADLFYVDPERARSKGYQRPTTREQLQGVKSYEELSQGRTDPAAQRAAQAAGGIYQSFGLGSLPDLVSTFSKIAEGQLSGRNGTGLPLAEPQRTLELADQYPYPLAISTTELRDYVANVHEDRLELPEATYAHIAASLNAGKHIILTGPPGSAKTSLAIAVCDFVSRQRFEEVNQGGVTEYRPRPAKVGEKFTPGYHMVTATSDWTTFDTVGGYMPDQNGALQFRLGAFLDAIRKGEWLIIDEINRAEIDKAFGPLFTVLSGQGVELPYRVAAETVCVRPAENDKARPWSLTDRRAWIPGGVTNDDFTYVIHPNWRIIGTMNVYDKSSLFQMSLAFMRRFAFIDVELPSDPTYARLALRWWKEYIQPHQPANSEKLRLLLFEILWQSHKSNKFHYKAPEDRLSSDANIHLKPQLLLEKNPLMKRRAIGPAIVRDLFRYIGDRCRDNPGGELQQYLVEAFALYVTPQLDGLDFNGIRNIYYHFDKRLFYDLSEAEREQILSRIRALYPHIQTWGKPEQEDT